MHRRSRPGVGFLSDISIDEGFARFNPKDQRKTKKGLINEKKCAM
jgi:hypothetical protein